MSTKFYWGLENKGVKINQRNTLNRKYLSQPIDGSLKRMQLDFIDLVYCQRPDPHTPIEETVFAMSDMIIQGKALYWGTSEWSAGDIRAAYEIADRHHLHKPVMEQPQYNLLHRKRVEDEYSRLYDDMQLGLTTWSPLASGLLTGKYRDGIPKGSRSAMEDLSFLRAGLTDEKKNAAVGQLSDIAKELGGNVAQLTMAWVNKNPRVSTVILGTSKLIQLQDNLGALALTPKLTSEILTRCERFGDFRVVHTRHSRWSKSGVWKRIFDALAQDADNEYAMIDSTIVRAHQHSAGAKGGAWRNKRLGAVVVA